MAGYKESSIANYLSDGYWKKRLKIAQAMVKEGLLEHCAGELDIREYKIEDNGKVIKNEIDEVVIDKELDIAVERMKEVESGKATTSPCIGLFDRLYISVKYNYKCPYCNLNGCDSMNDMTDEFCHIECAKKVLKGTFDNIFFSDYRKDQKRIMKQLKKDGKTYKQIQSICSECRKIYYDRKNIKCIKCGDKLYYEKWNRK